MTTTEAPPADPATETPEPDPTPTDGQPSDDQSLADADAGPPPTAQLMTILGAVAAPTTLLTSLLFFIGWNHAYWYFHYFGVNSTVLGLTTQDYVMRSQDALFVPVIAVGVVTLLGVWGHSALRDRLRAGQSDAADGTRRTANRSITAAGGTLLGLGLVGTAFATPLDLVAAAVPMCLAAGIVLLAYAGRLRAAGRASPDRRRRRVPPRVAFARWAGVFTLAGISLFWAAGDYSAAVGETQAANTLAGLPDEPVAVLYSERSLSLRGSGVTETKCVQPEASYQFRYDGLALLLQAGDRYVFLPRDWDPDTSAAVVLPATDAVRLEFRPPGAPELTNEEKTAC